MKRLAIVGNQLSGRRSAAQHARAGRAYLWGRKCDFYSPKSVLELRNISERLNSDDYEACVVIGGDGTLNQVIRAFKTQPNLVPIFAFPGGTANDLATELGLRADWSQVQTLIDQKQHTLIDLIEVNQHLFATVGGVGVGSIFTEEFNRWRVQSRLFRSAAGLFHSQIYSVLAANTILLQKDYVHTLRIRGSGFDETLKTPAVFFCNQDSIGGNIRVAPPLDNTDERFNVLVITSCTRAGLLRAMLQAKMGRIPTDSFVFSTDTLSIKDLDQRKISAFGDGEPLVSASQLDFKVVPQSLRVYRDTRSSRISFQNRVGAS